MPSSFHSTPLPDASCRMAMPLSTLSGLDTIAFHQSAYSSQWAVAVRQSSCKLTSGQRWIETGIPCIALFELEDDRRPVAERTATGRYQEPSLFSG